MGRALGLKLKGLMILALSVASYTTLTKSLNCSEPQFILICKMEEIVSIS